MRDRFFVEGAVGVVDFGEEFGVGIAAVYGGLVWLWGGGERIALGQERR